VAAPPTIRLRERPTGQGTATGAGGRHWKPFSTQRAFLELVHERRRRRRRLH